VPSGGCGTHLAPGVEPNLPLDGGGRRGWGHKHRPKHRHAQKVLIPAPRHCPHTPSHSRHHAAPTQGRAGRLETGAPVWPLVEARQPRLQYSVLDTGPGEEAPDRDGRPLAP
jgi:hypothetical protein